MLSASKMRTQSLRRPCFRSHSVRNRFRAAERSSGKRAAGRRLRQNASLNDRFPSQNHEPSHSRLRPTTGRGFAAGSVNWLQYAAKPVDWSIRRSPSVQANECMRPFLMVTHRTSSCLAALPRSAYGGIRLSCSSSDCCCCCCCEIQVAHTDCRSREARAVSS